MSSEAARGGASSVDGVQAGVEDIEVRAEEGILGREVADMLGQLLEGLSVLPLDVGQRRLDGSQFSLGRVRRSSGGLGLT